MGLSNLCPFPDKDACTTPSILFCTRWTDLENSFLQVPCASKRIWQIPYRSAEEVPELKELKYDIASVQALWWLFQALIATDDERNKENEIYRFGKVDFWNERSKEKMFWSPRKIQIAMLSHIYTGFSFGLLPNRFMEWNP